MKDAVNEPRRTLWNLAEPGRTLEWAGQLKALRRVIQSCRVILTPDQRLGGM
jgi:hypothetical protein